MKTKRSHHRAKLLGLTRVGVSCEVLRVLRDACAQGMSWHSGKLTPSDLLEFLTKVPDELKLMARLFGQGRQVRVSLEVNAGEKFMPFANGSAQALKDSKRTVQEQNSSNLMMQERNESNPAVQILLPVVNDND